MENPSKKKRLRELLKILLRKDETENEVELYTCKKRTTATSLRGIAMFVSIFPGDLEKIAIMK